MEVISNAIVINFNAVNHSYREKAEQESRYLFMRGCRQPENQIMTRLLGAL